jgi:hypothetical protein
MLYVRRRAGAAVTAFNSICITYKGAIEALLSHKRCIRAQKTVR